MPERPHLSDIIQGCINADRFSQKEFYQYFYGYAAAICMRYCSNNDDVTQIVNDGFLKVYKSLSQFNPRHPDVEASLKGWMKRIMINTAIDHLRKNNQRFLVAEISDTHFNVMEESASSIDQMSFKEILGIIQQLSPVYRTVFNLYVMDGYKHEEIAKQLNISVGASKSNLSKARMNIQKMLKEKDNNFYGQKAI
ncbi:MAG: RNA polymerase sigma factor [Chitinophagaceae bacterium]|nr:MAG: RNA polymerase sigma factor [Chitinophagaceae bacterium]